MSVASTFRAVPSSAGGGRQGRMRGRSLKSNLLLPRAQRSSNAPSIADPKDVLLNDAEFLLNAHEKLVSALNPHATERLEEDLLIEIGSLQLALDEAARDAAAAEAALRASLSSLSELEAEARALSAVAGFSPPAAPPVAAPGAAAAAATAAAAAAAPVAVAVEEQREAKDRRQQRSRKRSGSSSSSSSSSSPAASLAAAGLSASLDLSPRLREFWHPVAFSRDVKGTGEALFFDLFDARWALRRGDEGGGGGAPSCVLAPAAPAPARAPPSTWPDAPRSLPTRERDGLVWAWPGSGAPPAALPAFAAPPRGYTVHAELTMEVPVDSTLLLENLLDLAHAPFTHTGTFARGWPVPDAVTFKAREALGGVWDPYPIDMCYAPPCGTLSLIGMRAPGAVARGEASGGGNPPASSSSSPSSAAAASSSAAAASSSRHLHQMHVVLPAGRGRVRLLYRMCLDFWPWAARVPLAARLWRVVADRVLGEDLVLVAGQQDRLARGGDVWANPVPYDKLGVRCRRWRNAVAAGDESAARLALPNGGGEGGGGGGGGGRGGGGGGDGTTFMSAGELLFATEDE